MEMTEAPVPVPADREVRITVQRVGICGSDLTIYRGLHPYVSYPLVLGHEIAGVIDAVGNDVDKNRIGERVAVIPHIVCGACEACRSETYNFCEKLRCTGAEADGAHCDRFCISAKMAVKIPDTMTIDDAALMEPACVAYHGAKRGHITAGDNVLIVGAGPIGMFCMGCARVFGAAHVYIADTDTSRLALAKRLDADGTIDVTAESISNGLQRLCGSEKNIDLFYDCVGEKGGVLDTIIRIARRGARIVVIGVLQNEYAIPRLPDFVQHELSLSGTTMYTPQDYRDMIILMDEKKIVTDGMISHRFPLEKVPDILEMLHTKTEKTFKIMLDVNPV